MLVMSKSIKGVSGFVSSVLNSGGSAAGDSGRIEYVFTFLKNKKGIFVFAHINNTILLENGMVKRSRMEDGDLQKLLDQVNTKIQ